MIIFNILLDFIQFIMVFIGDYIGTIEEFIPEDGTYVEDGKIYAAVMGDLKQNNEKKIVFNMKLPRLMVGSIVLAEITDVRNNSATAKIIKFLRYKQNVFVSAGIFVSQISDEYADKVSSFLGVGDIVKAKIVRNEKNLIDLSTKGNFGVVKAFCKVCRHELILNKEKIGSKSLICPNCKGAETRKIASDYGDVKDVF
ncbi:putative Exosome complex RNA-binding protein Csl4 [groundwater metagenome]|uniref:Putative Exosome complex RNA-binding protein Csl4 n=1 Tax=groundwater metagenome TaxID=717931 RepID=A0A098E7T3_9ZZZZ